MPKKRQMLGSMTRVVKKNRALAALLCVAVVSGCYWRSYPDRVRTHTELLVAFARKARDLVATGRFTAESLPELTYPLERAAAYAAEGRRRAATAPASLVAFEALVARYRAFVDLVDETRRSRRGPEAAKALDEPLAALEADARAVTAMLDLEREGRAGSAPR